MDDLRRAMAQPAASEVERVLAAAAAPEAVVAPAATAVEPVAIRWSPELRKAIKEEERPMRSSPTRYAGLYNLLGGMDEARRTLLEVPLGGVVRALAENGGLSPDKALLLERGAALGSVGIGVPALLAAAGALNGDDRQVVVVQGAGR